MRHLPARALYSNIRTVCVERECIYNCVAVEMKSCLSGCSRGNLARKRMAGGKLRNEWSRGVGEEEPITEFPASSGL